MDTRVQRAYDELKKTKIKYGNYKKTLFHVHTPASYDYKLSSDFKNSEEYQKATTEEIHSKVIKNEFLQKFYNTHDKNFSLPKELSLLEL